MAADLPVRTPPHSSLLNQVNERAGRPRRVVRVPVHVGDVLRTPVQLRVMTTQLGKQPDISEVVAQQVAQHVGGAQAHMQAQVDSLGAKVNTVVGLLQTLVQRVGNDKENAA